MKSGIYIITNDDNGKVYIGQSIDVKRRLQDHKVHLKAGRHENKYMQCSYNTHNGRFSFKPLVFCGIDQLDELECYYIRKYRSNERRYGYNIQSGGHAGHTWNEEAKDARRGSGNPMYGHKLSAERVQQIIETNRGSSDKLTFDDVCSIKKALYDHADGMTIAKEYGVTVSTISKIKRCSNWEWVMPELNDKLRQMFEQQMQDNAADRELEECRKAFNEARRLNKIKNVRNAFRDGYSKADIMKRYHVSETSYVRYTTDLYNAQKEYIVTEARRLRAEGMQVKDIADKLGLHRTTVTEYTKQIQDNAEGI